MEFRGGSFGFLDSSGGSKGGLAINGGHFEIQALNAGTNLAFLTDSGTRRATIFNSTGNVNIGATTTDPSAKLRVQGLLLTDASDTAEAGLRLPHGVAPTSPVDGDVWTTTTGTFVRVNGGTIELGYRNVPRSTTTTTAVIGDRGACIAASAGITIPNATFAAGDSFSIYNDSASSITITQGASLTLREAGTANTGNRTLAARGLCTVWFNSASEAIITGPGLT
jgi:hypothetical protein